jgi:hypothetical protein
MMHYGFITGLPRSGSAWLANYLSYGNCMFLHDAWKHGSPDEIKQKFESSSVYASGTADPANVMLLDKIDKSFPDAKWVVITRPVEEVKESCEAINFPFVDFTNNLKGLMSSRKVLKVPFKTMFKRADEIGRFIYPDWDSPPWRKSMLSDLNVQLHWGKVSDQFKVPENIKEADVMTPAKIEFLRLIKEIVNEDPNALSFVRQAMNLSELSKRIDQGKPFDVRQAMSTLESVSTEWLINPFVRNFNASLAPAIMSAIEKYRNEPDRGVCPVDLELLTTVCYIFKGNDGVKEFMPRVRELSNKILQERQWA